MKVRLLSLALIAMLVQATLPFLTATCPFNQAVHAIVNGGSPADKAMAAGCPMLAGTQAAGVNTDASHSGPQKTHAVAFCALCAALSPFHGYVAAGLVSLPPPMDSARFVSFRIVSLPALPALTSAFSARAPPYTA